MFTIFPLRTTFIKQSAFLNLSSASYQKSCPWKRNWSYFKLFFYKCILFLSFYLSWKVTRCWGQDPNHCSLWTCVVVLATLSKNSLFFSHHVSLLLWNFRFLKISAPYAHETICYLFPTLSKWSDCDSEWELCYLLNVSLGQWRGRQGGAVWGIQWRWSQGQHTLPTNIYF